MNNAKWFTQWIPLVALALMAVAGWMTVRFQADAAMPRTEAYQIFDTIAAQDRFEGTLDKRLQRMEDKIDDLLAR